MPVLRFTYAKLNITLQINTRYSYEAYLTKKFRPINGGEYYFMDMDRRTILPALYMPTDQLIFCIYYEDKSIISVIQPKVVLTFICINKYNLELVVLHKE